MGNVEAGAEVYDAVWAKVSTDRGEIRRSFYYPLFKHTLARTLDLKPTGVLEVGCGSGRFAQLFVDASPVPYRGFDFSGTAVEKSAERLGRPELFFQGDALDPAIYAREPHDTIVCTEVLEHIERDLDVIALWRPGTKLVLSVPNFDFKTHVRHFAHEREVQARYGDLVDIAAIGRVAKPLMGGQTRAQWLRQLVWLRGDPKRLLGHIGINRFDWGAGWFVFTGTRR